MSIKSIVEYLMPSSILRGMIGITVIWAIVCHSYIYVLSYQIQTLKLACESSTYPNSAKACDELKKVLDDQILGVGIFRD